MNRMFSSCFKGQKPSHTSMRLHVDRQLQLMRELHEAQSAREGLVTCMSAAHVTVVGGVRGKSFATELALKDVRASLDLSKNISMIVIL